MTSKRKRLLISEEVAILPAKKIDMTSRKGMETISSQISPILSNMNKTSSLTISIEMNVVSITLHKTAHDIIHKHIPKRTKDRA